MLSTLALLAVASTTATATATAAPATRSADVPPAAPQPDVVTTVTARTPIAAAGGWVLWSEPSVEGWVLVGSHDGNRTTFAISPNRKQPFDVSVGTDAQGKPAAVFARCVDPAAIDDAFAGGIVPSAVDDCEIHQLDLTTGVESVPAIPKGKGTSDSTPAIAGGRIAFGRFDRAHRSVEQVRLWTPGSKHLRVLQTGALPYGCSVAGKCRHGQTARGSIQGLAFDGARVAFLWRPVGPGVEGDGAWELRRDELDTGRSTLVDVAVLGEACTGPSEMLSRPALVVGQTVWVKVTDDCYQRSSQLQVVHGKHRRAGDLDGSVIDFAGGAGGGYALVAQQPTEQVFPTCSVAMPCEIRHERPALRAVRTPKVASPFI